ncbi:V-type ATP synthase subunit F [Patescibacteria group bacterium]
MDNTYSIAIIGNKDTILGFKALGLETHDANNAEEATKILYDLKGQENMIDEKKDETQPKFAIIFITEELAMNINKDDYKKLGKQAIPAIIPIPGSTGTTGYGLKRIGKMVEQAVGSDIFK